MEWIQYSLCKVWEILGLKQWSRKCVREHYETSHATHEEAETFAKRQNG